MTALDTAPAGFLSTQAAQGARRARVDEIDRFYAAVRDDIEAQRIAEWDRAITDSCKRIASITQDITLDEHGRLTGYILRVHFATLKLHQEIRDMREQKIAIETRAFYSHVDAEKARKAERSSFAFGGVA